MRYCAQILNLIIIVTFLSCSYENEKKPIDKVVSNELTKKITKDTVISDCNYTFEEAIEGTKAPFEVINQLQLIKVRYYSTDGKIHEGQVLTNKKIANDIKQLFTFMFQEQFPIAKAIPIVRYNWDDNLSMQDNNTYSFCYRNTSFSKHAKGLAIDINPYFNPVRWKKDSILHTNKPLGAKYNTAVSGTFYPENSVVLKLKNLGFRWGRYFKRKYDDHHFEK